VPRFLKSTTDLIRKVYILAHPYGRRKLVIVIGFSFIQGLFQVLGVTSILPFLALAADPDKLRNSQVGGKFLNALPPMDDHRLLLVAGILAIVMLCLANGMSLLGDFVRNRYSLQFGHWLRVRLLRKIVSRQYTDFLQQNSALLGKKIVGDVMTYIGGVLLPLLDSLARTATIVLLVATLVIADPQATIYASVGFGLFYVAVFRGFGSYRYNISEGIKAAYSGTHAEVHQMLGGIKAVKIHRAEDAFICRFAYHSELYGRFHISSALLGSGPRYLVETLAFGGLVLMVLAYSARGQDLMVILPNLGIMALVGYRLLPALQQLYSQVTLLTTQRHSLDEVFDEFVASENTFGMDAQSADEVFSSPGRLSWEQAITLDDLSFHYPGAEKPVLSRLSLCIKKNSSFGIVGTTGCGKSTLVDLILGLHVPNSGRILIDDTPLGLNNRRVWLGGIGYVPQEIFLVDDSIAANIAFGVPQKKYDLAALERAAASAQILDFILYELPHGWETVVGERGVRLSGGQRQRIGLARALYHQPDLLILDEATSALDNETEDAVMQAIAGLNGQITIIVIAHRLRTIEMCDEKLDLSRHLKPGMVRFSEKHVSHYPNGS
jgi:ABC-type multidrug transport system fused ATPase/permease subunit